MSMPDADSPAPPARRNRVRQPRTPEPVPPEVVAYRAVRDALAAAGRGLDPDQGHRFVCMVVCHVMGFTAGDAAGLDLSPAQCERLARFCHDPPPA